MKDKIKNKMKNSELENYLNLASWAGEMEYNWRLDPSEQNRDNLIMAMEELSCYKQEFGQPSESLLKRRGILCWENMIRDGNYFGSEYLIGKIIETGRITSVKSKMPFSILAVENEQFRGLDLYENYCGGSRAGAIIKGRLYLINDSVEKRGLPWSAVFEEITVNLQQYEHLLSRRGSR